MNLETFCRSVGFPKLKTWAEAVDRVRRLAGAPEIRGGRFSVRPTGSGNMWIDCDGTYLGLLCWEGGRWRYLGGPSDAIRECGFRNLHDVQEGLHDYLQTLAPPQ